MNPFRNLCMLLFFCLPNLTKAQITDKFNIDIGLAFQDKVELGDPISLDLTLAAHVRVKSFSLGGRYTKGIVDFGYVGGYGGGIGNAKRSHGFTLNIRKNYDRRHSKSYLGIGYGLVYKTSVPYLDEYIRSYISPQDTRSSGYRKVTIEAGCYYKNFGYHIIASIPGRSFEESLKDNGALTFITSYTINKNAFKHRKTVINHDINSNTKYNYHTWFTLSVGYLYAIPIHRSYKTITGMLAAELKFYNRTKHGVSVLLLANGARNGRHTPVYAFTRDPENYLLDAISIQAYYNYPLYSTRRLKLEAGAAPAIFYGDALTVGASLRVNARSGIFSSALLLTYPGGGQYTYAGFQMGINLNFRKKYLREEE